MKNNFDIKKSVDKDNIQWVVNQGKRKKFWFNEGNYMFKFQKKGSLESYAEIFIYKLAKLVNIPCAEYFLKSYDNNLGVVTINFILDNEKFLTGADFMIDIDQNITGLDDINIDKMMKKNNVKDIIQLLKMYMKQNGIYNYNKLKSLKQSIYKIYVFDLLTLQTDRNPFNWGILLNLETKNIEFAPIYDNSNIANLNTPKFIKEINEGKTEFAIKKLINSFSPLLSFDKTDKALKLVENEINNNYSQFLSMFKVIKKNYLKVLMEIKENLGDKYNENFDFIIKKVFSSYFQIIDNLIMEVTNK